MSVKMPVFIKLIVFVLIKLESTKIFRICRNQAHILIFWYTPVRNPIRNYFKSLIA
jgi:hypothetical protein